MLKFFLIFILFSCSGYRLKKNENPFSQYGVNSITIPMFYNYSAFSSVSPTFTSEFYNLLSEFKDLKIYSGNKNADAVFIGIVGSSEALSKTRSSENLRTASDLTKETLEKERARFNIPTTTTNHLSVRIIVVKHPTKEELEFLHTDLSKVVKISSKIIMDEIFSVSSSFTREVHVGEGSAVNATQNKGAEKDNLKNMAISAARTFKTMVLHAF